MFPGRLARILLVIEECMRGCALRRPDGPRTRRAGGGESPKSPRTAPPGPLQARSRHAPVHRRRVAVRDGCERRGRIKLYCLDLEGKAASRVRQASAGRSRNATSHSAGLWAFAESPGPIGGGPAIGLQAREVPRAGWGAVRHGGAGRCPYRTESRGVRPQLERSPARPAGDRIRALASASSRVRSWVAPGRARRTADAAQPRDACRPRMQCSAAQPSAAPCVATN